jgi:hypothetical protein
MVRSSLQADATYVAVCRSADDRRLRMYARTTATAAPAVTENDIVVSPAHKPETPAFVQLVVSDGGTCATASGSLDGEAWVEIGQACVEDALVHQGLAASGHGADGIRFLFGNVTLGSEVLAVADFAVQMAIGDVTAEVFDGVVP